MKSGLRHGLISCALLLLSACQSEQAQTVSNIELLDGPAISAEQRSGKWLIINYWASWCKNCVAEIAEFNAFAKAHQDKAIVLAFNYDFVSHDQVRQLNQQFNIQYPSMIADPAKLFQLSEVRGLPTTLIINPQGKLSKTLLGSQTQASLEKNLL